MSAGVKSNVMAAYVKDLRHCIANAVSEFKAYDVPVVCKTIGLAGGTTDEAFASKYKYVMSRVTGETTEKLITVSYAFLAEDADYNLSEALNKIEESDRQTISEITRRRIISVFENRPICTEIEEMEFLKRVWPIDKMPPAYGSSGSLQQDVYQHTVNNCDWSNRELFEYLGAFKSSQFQFFKFIEAVTDPTVQTDANQAQIVEQINSFLVHDDYKLVQSLVQSGCPFYEVRQTPKGAPSDENISRVLKAFNPNEIHARWGKIIESRDNDPERTITLARTLLEDVCKWIIVESGQTYEEKAELSDLYKQLSKILKLAPDEHTEEIFKQILRGCHSVVQGLGALRNKLSDAHSVGPIRAKPSHRHAELAANLSGAMATFLVSTWRTRQDEARVKNG